MISVIDRSLCIGCGACKASCSADAVRMLPGWKAEVLADRCIGCGTCEEVCHRHAPRML